MNKEIENIAKPGRPKGSPNARTQDLFDITEKLDCNPFEVLILFAKGDIEALGVSEISPDLRLRAAKDACDYLFPKRKAVEHSSAASEDGLLAKWFRELDAREDPRPISFTEITEEK
jgi:hypothetical protein